MQCFLGEWSIFLFLGGSGRFKFLSNRNHDINDTSIPFIPTVSEFALIFFFFFFTINQGTVR